MHQPKIAGYTETARHYDWDGTWWFETTYMWPSKHGYREVEKEEFAKLIKKDNAELLAELSANPEVGDVLIIGCYIWVELLDRKLERELRKVGFHASSNKRGWMFAAADRRGERPNREENSGLQIGDLQEIYDSTLIARGAARDPERAGTAQTERILF